MKTKIASLFIFAAILSISGSASFAQTGGNPTDARCDTYLVRGRTAMSREEFKRATQYFFSADNQCNEKLGRDDFRRFIYSAQEVLYSVVDSLDETERKSAVDMLLWAWERAEARGFYDVSDDAGRGVHYPLGSRPNYARADYYMKRAIEREGADIGDQSVLTIYFSNIYTLWAMEKDTAKKAKLKQRLVTEHSRLSKLAKDAGFSQGAQQTLDQYLSEAN